MKNHRFEGATCCECNQPISQDQYEVSYLSVGRGYCMDCLINKLKLWELPEVKKDDSDLNSNKKV